MSLTFQGTVTLGVVIDTSKNNNNYLYYGKNTAKVRVFELHGFDSKIINNLLLTTTDNKDLPWIRILLPPGSNPDEEQGLYQIGDLVYVQCATDTSADVIVVGLYQTNNPLNIVTYYDTLSYSRYNPGETYSYNYIKESSSTLGQLYFPLAEGKFRVTGWFGYEPGEAYGHPGSSRFHKGIDLGAGKGTPIYSAFSGRVSKVRYNIYDNRGGTGYGNYCKVYNEETGFTTTYAHQSEVVVHEGDVVNSGDILGKVGTTGDSTGNHLHFEIILPDGQTYQDPFDYFPEVFQEHLLKDKCPRFDELNQPRLHFYKF